MRLIWRLKKLTLCEAEIVARKTTLPKLYEIKSKLGRGELTSKEVLEMTHHCFMKGLGKGVNCRTECPLESDCYYHEARVENDKRHKKS